ncbi:MAG: RNA polymerase sigma factor [Acidimicrobiia bacterium]
MAGEDRSRFTDLELIARSRAGDRAALGELLHRYSRWIRWACLTATDRRVPQVDMEDAMAATFRSTVRSIHGLRATTEAEFRAWLRQIARNETRAVIKPQATELFDPMDEAQRPDRSRVDPSPDLAERFADQDALRRCLESLRRKSVDHYRTLILYANEDPSSQLAAELLSTDADQVNASTARSWLKRAREHMAGCLGLDSDDGGEIVTLRARQG